MHAHIQQRQAVISSRAQRNTPTSMSGVLGWLKNSSTHKRRVEQHAEGVPTASPAAATAAATSVLTPLSATSAPASPPQPAQPLPMHMTLQLSSASAYLPHPDKVHYGGEDAHFISSKWGGAIGVADGVGGWQESGVNPADYSRMFMKLACAYLEGSDIFEEEAMTRAQHAQFVDPRGALNAAHLNTKVPGSATACVVQLDQSTNTLTAANLGDSGFVVIRNGAVLVRSKALQHYFDCPLQFGAFPEFVEATDTADMADLYLVPLQPNDVVIAGSDGLWDNVFDSELLQLAPTSSGDVQQAADRIAAVARGHASDADFPSPYTREALSQGLDLPWWEKLIGVSFKNGRLQLRQLSGGKMDDITVIVSWVAAIPREPQGNGSRTESQDGADKSSS